MNDELKPCAHCGSEETSVNQYSRTLAGQSPGSPIWRVFCLSCGDIGPSRAARTEAVAAWNRRVPAPAAGMPVEVREAIGLMLQRFLYSDLSSRSNAVLYDKVKAWLDAQPQPGAGGGMMLQLSDRQPHTVISCGEGHHHVIGLATLRRWVAAQLPYDNIEPCLVRSIVADWLPHSDVSPDDDAWVRLGDLPPGLLFATQTGALAVKTEYHHIGGQCRCVLLGSGEYASFAGGNDTLVMAMEIA